MTRTIREGVHKIAGLDVSWVGECPWTKTLCFGGEDGTLVILPPSFPMNEGGTFSTQLATDAINAVAFAGEYVAVSSRNEVVVGKRPDAGSDRLSRFAHPFIGGAHGVVAAREPSFLAPIGDQGLLILSGADAGRINAQIACHPDVPFNFYKVVRLGNGLQKEAFAAAARRHGLLALSFESGISSAPMIRPFTGHDIVDVCPLNDPHFPLAVAFVSRSCVIFLVRNVLEDHAPLALSLGGLQGTAYTLLSPQGHLLLLTDQQLIALPNIASRFLRGEPFDNRLEVVSSPADAAEAFVLHDRTVLLIEEDSTVAELGVADLVGDLAEKRVETALSGNGQFSQSSSIEVTRDVRPLLRIESDQEWGNSLELQLVPAA
jgi:hypothetical protein